jgi:hypothetical protein
MRGAGAAHILRLIRSLHRAELHLVSSSPGLITAHHAPSIPSRVPYSSTNAQPLLVWP